MRYRLQFKFAVTRGWSNWYSTTRSSCSARFPLPSGIYGRDRDGTFPNEIEAAIFVREIRNDPQFLHAFDTRIIAEEID